MSVRQLIWAAACVFGISAGQVLFKAAASTMGAFNRRDMILHLVTNIYFCIAICVYGLTTLVWVSLLRAVPLKVVYPLMGLVFLVVPLFGRFFLNEKLEMRTFLGGLVIIIGIYISVK